VGGGAADIPPDGMVKLPALPAVLELRYTFQGP
jgi:hypothetical protein